MATLSIQQSRLQDDLRGIISGDVRCDDVLLQLYSTDAGMFERRPVGVVYPRSVKDVVAAVRYAAEMKLPIHPRGSGTGLVGGSLGNGLVLDFTRYMKRMIHADERSVLVQPGAVRERVNDLLRRTKRHFFAPSAGHLPTNTIGSILATDAVGPRHLRYGFPHDHVLELQIVLPDGTVKNLRPVPLNSVTDPLEKAIVQIVRNASNEIAQEQRPNALNCSGYRLEGVVQNGTFDFARLVTGSEGTLGIITEARLSTTVLSNDPGAVVFLFDSMEKAAKAILPILESRPTLCEMIDRRVLNMVRDWDRRFVQILPTDTEVAVVVELDCDSPTELNDRLNELVSRIRRREGLSFGSWLALRHAETELFRDLLRKSQVALYRISRPFQIISLLEDVVVPVEVLPEFIHEIQNVLKKNKITYSLGGRIGLGQIRLQPILDARTPSFQDTIAQWSSDVFDVVEKFGGTFGATNGVGRAKSLTIPKRYPKLFPVFQKIKQTIDPDDIFNPEIIVPRYKNDGATRAFSGDETSRSADRVRLNSDFPVSENRDSQPSESVPEKDSESKSVAKNNRSFGETSKTKSRFDFSQSDYQKLLKKDSSFAKSSSVDESFSVVRTSLTKTEVLRKLSGDYVFRSVFLGDKSPLAPFLSAPLESAADSETIAPPRNSFDDQLAFQLKWDAELVAETTLRCSGCGLCRSRTPEVRMCPIFRHTPDETASCRAKANYLRGILEGKLQLETLTEDDARILSDFCLFCHCCVQECPSRIDVPKLVFRTKSAYNAAHGLTLEDKFFSNVDPILNVASVFSCIMNYIQTNRFARWILEKTFSLPQGRKLPKLSRLSYLSRLALKKRQTTSVRRSERKVALFIDTYANHYDLKLIDAAIKILEHNGVTVLVPRRQKNSGHQSFALGDSYRAEIVSQRNVDVLIDAVRQGFQVVTLEPISAVCISQEYLYLHDDPETRLVAENTTDVCSYLYRLHQEGKLELNFSPLPYTVGYHAPCRTLVLTREPLDVATPAQELLQLIPALNVRRLERGCCGSGGVIGMRKKNYAQSLRLGMPLFLALREPSIQLGCSECNSCRIQMEQGTDKNVLHPLKILAFAYGLAPEFAPLFNNRSEQSRTIT